MAQREEETLMVVRLSRWKALGFLFSKIMITFLAVLLVVGYYAFFVAEDPMLHYFTYFLFGLYLIVYLTYVFRVRKRRIELTTKRIIHKQGRSIKKFTFIPLRQIAAIDVETSRMGRRFNYGHIIFKTTGMTELSFYYVTRPYEVVDEIFNLYD